VITETPFQDIFTPGFGDFPPVGVVVNWTDSEANSGSFVSSGTFCTVPYGHHGAASYFLVFNMVGTPSVSTIWPISISLDVTVAWGIGYLRRNVRPTGSTTITTEYTW
jgi:hypothetical protein